MHVPGRQAWRFGFCNDIHPRDEPPMSLRPFARTALAALAIAAATPAFAQNAAVVNGKPIPKARVDEFMQMLAAQGRAETPELRAQVRDLFINREIMLQAAEQKQIARHKEVQAEIANKREEIIIEAFLRDHLKNNPVTEADIKAEYQRVVKAQGDKEYKARHILVESEDTAKKIIADLKAGKKFEDLAKQSKDTGSAQQGGDLDWNAPGTFVPEFSAAMTKLGKGQLTESPVKTQYGWHVIRVDDVRDAAPPPLEAVKPQIQQELQKKRIQELQQKLRASAKIQ